MVMGELGEIVRVERSARNHESQRVNAFVAGRPLSPCRSSTSPWEGTGSRAPLSPRRWLMIASARSARRSVEDGTAPSWATVVLSRFRAPGVLKAPEDWRTAEPDGSLVAVTGIVGGSSQIRAVPSSDAVATRRPSWLKTLHTEAACCNESANG